MKSSLIIHPEELSKKWIDRIAAAGVSTLGIHPRGGEIAPQTLAALLREAETPEYRSLIDYARGLGLEIEYEIHSLGFLLPRELFSEHPEYFRVDADGKRNNDYNLCVSCKEAMDILYRHAGNFAKNYEENAYHNLSPDMLEYINTLWETLKIN